MESGAEKDARIRHLEEENRRLREEIRVLGSRAEENRGNAGVESATASQRGLFEGPANPGAQSAEEHISFSQRTALDGPASQATSEATSTVSSLGFVIADEAVKKDVLANLDEFERHSNALWRPDLVRAVAKRAEADVRMMRERGDDLSVLSSKTYIKGDYRGWKDKLGPIYNVARDAHAESHAKADSSWYGPTQSRGSARTGPYGEWSGGPSSREAELEYHRGKFDEKYADDDLVNLIRFIRNEAYGEHMKQDTRQFLVDQVTLTADHDGHTSRSRASGSFDISEDASMVGPGSGAKPGWWLRLNNSKTFRGLGLAFVRTRFPFIFTDVKVVRRLAHDAHTELGFQTELLYMVAVRDVHGVEEALTTRGAFAHLEKVCKGVAWDRDPFKPYFVGYCHSLEEGDVTFLLSASSITWSVH